MSIVDVFTKLIFDSESALNSTETLIVELLGHLDPSVAHASRRDVSEYLRSMGVDEMISMVNQIKHYLEQQQGVIAAAKDGLSSTLRR